MDDSSSTTPMSFAIETDDAHVRVSFHGEEAPTATDFYDANWLRTTISVRIGAMMGGAFAANVTATLRTDEVDAFRTELAELVEGRREAARFESMEEWLQLEVSLDDDGWRVIGMVCDQPALGSALRFQFFQVESRQIRNLQRQLADVLKVYPIVGSPMAGLEQLVVARGDTIRALAAA